LPRGIFIAGEQYFPAEPAQEGTDSLVELRVHHTLPESRWLEISSTGCRAEPTSLQLQPGEEGTLQVFVEEGSERELDVPLFKVIEVTVSDPGVGRETRWRGFQTDLSGWMELKACEGSGEYRGQSFHWAGKEPLDVTFAPRAVGLDQPAKSLELLLLWGSKKDPRGGQLRFSSGETILIDQGGHDGFRWIRVLLPDRMRRADALRVMLLPRKGYAEPFVAAIGLRTGTPRS
jgi:hypothetical protein